MSCTGCASKFTFLKSEHGCPGCGFSYCSKCLCEKISLKENSKPVAVCKNCATARTNSNSDRRQSQPTPVTSGQYGCHVAEPGQLPPPSMRAAAVQRATSIGGEKLNPEERALKERLEKLKEDFKTAAPPMSQTELEIRLAKLKGKSFDEHVAEKSKPFYFGPDNRTPAQRAADLMSQMREELDLERKLRRPEQEIAERLARLKGEEIKEHPESDQHEDSLPSGGTGISGTKSGEEMAATGDEDLGEVEKMIRAAQRETETEAKEAMRGLQKDKELMDQLKKIREERAKKQTSEHIGQEDEQDDSAEEERVAKMIMEEDEIAERLSRLAPPPATLGDTTPTCPSPVPGRKEDDELPWCCICTEDAVVRCLGCDGDLYCRRCFREGHDQFDLKDHSTVPYQRKGPRMDDY